MITARKTDLKNLLITDTVLQLPFANALKMYAYIPKQSIASNRHK